MANKRLITILILATSVVLAVIALFTALKLYQIGQETPLSSPKPSAKTQPFSPLPSASPSQLEVYPQAETKICELTFSVLSSVSPSASKSPSPSPSASASPSPSPAPECWETCTSDSQCPGALRCQNVSGIQRCINEDCPLESDCLCPPANLSVSLSSGCWEECTEDNQCPGSLVCEAVSGVKRCVNNNCQDQSDCVCPPTAQAGSSPATLALASAAPAASAATTVPTQELPEAGFVSPTLIFSLGGLMLLLLGLLL